MGKRSEQVAKQKDKMLSASLTLFVTNGYHGTTVRDIAKAAGISVGLIFHYFPTKQDILEELLKETDKGNALFEKLLGSADAPLAVFSEIARLTLESFLEKDTKHHFLLLNQILTQKSIPFHSEMVRKSGKRIRLSVSVIEKGQNDKSIKPGDPHSLALAFWGSLQGVAEALFWHGSSSVPDYHCFIDMLRNTEG